MTHALENITDLDQLEGVKRFFVYGSLGVGDRIQLMLSARFPTKFYGFLSDKPSTDRHGYSAFSIRYWKEVLPQLGEGDFVFLTQGGNPPFQDGLVAQGVRFAQPFNVTSVYSTYETPTFLHFCKTYLGGKPGIGLDIGANTGLTGAMLARYCQHVYLFEPNPAMEQVIYDTNAGSHNLTVLMKAVARSSGEITVYSAGQNNMSAVAKEQSNPISVPCISVDDFCRESKVAPSVIKIDVEGVDAEVILGGAKTIETHLPVIFFEHPLLNVGSYDTDLDCARESLAFLSRFYDLLAYPTMDQLFPAEALGSPLETFQERFTDLPVNVAAIPKPQ